MLTIPSSISQHTTHRCAILRTAITRPAAAAFVALLIVGCSSKSSSSDTAAADSVAADTAAFVDMSAVKVYELPAPEHVETPISYPQSPPVGGDHNPAWQNCGSYADAVQNEMAVHSLEHGAVWITYRPGLADADVETLRARTINQTHLLVSPYREQASPVVLTAWGHQLALDSVKDPRIAAFIATYQEGVQTLEPGAPCSGAKGEPL
jgi:hypothetical protein